jgi:hypothetical protein
MLTRHLILEQLEHYLNDEITLAHLVDWAESALIEPDIPEAEDANLIMDTLAYLGAADSRGFPLTWEVLSDFITRLGGQVRVMMQV